MRYTDIQHDVTAASDRTLHPNTLTDTLEWLQDKGYVERRVDGPLTTYQLTPTGERISVVVDRVNDLVQEIDKCEP